MVPDRPRIEPFGSLTDGSALIPLSRLRRTAASDFLRQVEPIGFSLPLILPFIQTFRKLLSSKHPFPVQHLLPIGLSLVSVLPAALDQSSLHQLRTQRLFWVALT